jgi:hypothetical protein
MKKTINNKTELNEEAVISKALKRASEYWSINNKQLGEFCGLSEATISRLKNGQYVLDYNSKSWQLALIFLRIFRGLDAYMGGNVDNEKAWLKANNNALGGKPIELMKNVEGLASVAQYIDYARGNYN